MSALDKKAAWQRYYKKNKEAELQRSRRKHFKRKFGLELEQLEQLIKECKRKCFICKEFMQKVCVDHDHKTGKVRGLLCDRCNGGLGMFRDKPDLLEKAVDYLG